MDVIDAMRSQQIVYFTDPEPTYCGLKDEIVVIVNKQSRMSLSVATFSELYQDAVFYLHQTSSTDEIDLLKDMDYYSLRYR